MNTHPEGKKLTISAQLTSQSELQHPKKERALSVLGGQSSLRGHTRGVKWECAGQEEEGAGSRGSVTSRAYTVPSPALGYLV